MVDAVREQELRRSHTPADKKIDKLQAKAEAADTIVSTLTAAGREADATARQLTTLLAQAGLDSGSSVRINGTRYIYVIAGGMHLDLQDRAAHAALRTSGLERITVYAADPVLQRFLADAPQVTREFQQLALEQLDRDIRWINRQSQKRRLPVAARFHSTAAEIYERHSPGVRNAMIIAISAGVGIALGALWNPFGAPVALVGAALAIFFRNFWEVRELEQEKRDDIAAVRRQMSPVKRLDAIRDLDRLAVSLETQRRHGPAPAHRTQALLHAARAL